MAPVSPEEGFKKILDDLAKRGIEPSECSDDEATFTRDGATVTLSIEGDGYLVESDDGTQEFVSGDLILVVVAVAQVLQGSP